jgi:transposase InsO family protein
MEERTEVEKKNNRPPRGSARGATAPRYPVEFRVRAVKLCLEEGFPQCLVCQELNVSKSSLIHWLHRYRQLGEEGLKDQPSRLRGRHKLPAAITGQIVQLKQQYPTFGVKRISQWLRRLFFLPASAETVRQRLQQAGLASAPPSPKRRNLTRPRFFERATPNQMWQSDIFTFRLGGRYAYLIAFLDDYSRFVVGADLFRSPTAQAVIEVYRVAVGEFQPPREMLTDNGRQYTTWRGTSRFEAELKKDGVAHFKSRPHHPMTLGKIERFWESIWQEFLTRAQFDSFESARERIKLWIKYYNHKRPHQGIEGLCPADRFFEIQSELRQTMEAGIKENLLELALRGQPRAPFYMVGRMEGQSVVLRAEKGKLKLELSGADKEQELVYDLKNYERQDPTQNREEKEIPLPQPQCERQSPGGPGGMDRALQTGGRLPPDESQLDDVQPLAAPGDGRDAAGAGEPGEPGAGRSVEPTSCRPCSTNNNKRRDSLDSRPGWNSSSKTKLPARGRRRQKRGR